MRQSIIICFVYFALFQVNSINAQKTIKDPGKYQTWVYESKYTSEQGYLTFLSYDTIVLNSSIMFNNTVLARYNVNNVNQIRIRKKSNQGIGALIGLVGGGLIGYIAGSKYEGDDYCGNNCLGVQSGTVTALSTLGFAIVGTSIGVIIGSKKKKFRLGGKLTLEQYDQLQEYVNPMVSNN